MKKDPGRDRNVTTNKGGGFRILAEVQVPVRVRAVVIQTIFLLLVMLATTVVAQEPNDQVKLNETEQSLTKAIDFLFKQQAEDGGWHSEYYGALKSGAATTCLTLHALSHCPEELLADRREQILRARDFLLPQVVEHGHVTNKDGPDYVTYGSGMLLIADRKLKLGLNDETRLRLRDFLIAAQLDETQGYQPGGIDYGGWDLMGWAQSPRKSAGTNVSVSATALEALMQFDDEHANACRKRATAWLETCRTEEGGYFFHPRKDHDGNKAGWSDDEKRQLPRAYGTATCDGLRCLTALGGEADGPQRHATIRWIQQHLGVDGVPGLEDEKNKLGWRTGLHFYYLSSLAQVLPNLSEEKRESASAELVKLLIDKQDPAGFWQNSNARMREDDPLIATGLALTAFARVHSQKGRSD